jgi:hypothetical protein
MKRGEWRLKQTEEEKETEQWLIGFRYNPPIPFGLV